MILQQSGANLGPLQIAKDAERFVFFAADLADEFNNRQLPLMGTVRKIQANDIDARPHKIANDRLCV